MVLASGTRASLIYWRERVGGTKPAGLSAAATSISSAVGSATEATFTRASGSFIDDGYTPGQWIQASGFTVGAAVANGNWKIKSVDSATQVTVYDENDTIISGTGGTVQILAQVLRATGRNINLEKNTLQSEEVRASRQEADVRHGSNRVSGSPGFELSREAYDDMLEFATGGSWYTFAWDGTGTVAASAGGALRGTFTRSTGSWIDDGFRVGDIVDVSGYAASSGVNNGKWRIITLTDTVMTVYDPTDAIVTEASTASEEFALAGKRLDVGTTLHQFGMERRFDDVTQFQEFDGCAVNQLSLDIQPESIVGGTLDIIGMSAAAMASSSAAGITPRAAATNSPFSSFDGVIWEGGVTTGVATGVSFSVNNNRSLENVIGSPFSPAVFEGTNVTDGTLSVFFETASLFNKFVNESSSSVFLKLDDNGDATQFMNIVMPNLKYTGATMDPPQQGPIVTEMPFKALESDQAYPGGTTVPTNLWFQSSNSIYTS